jgi:cobalt-zinc-cadmium efflux system membrane fusion protein
MIAALWALLGCTSKEAEEHEGEHAEHGEHEGENGEHEGHGDEVVLSGAALANARLEVQALALVPLDGRVAVPARIALDPRREARVSAVTAGTLERILVRPGDQVKGGGALATVASPELGTAIGTHLSATAKLEAAKARRDRLSNLHAEGFSSKSQLQEAEADLTVAMAEAEASEERLRVFGVSPSAVRPEAGQHFASRFSVRSPVQGEVLAIEAPLGKSVTSGEALFHVGNLDEVWLVMDVGERHLASVHVGAQVSFTVEAYGSETFVGTVDQIGGILHPETRSLEVRVVVPNEGHRLKPNMFAHAQLALSSGSVGEGLVVPAEAVQEVEGKSSVFVEEAPGRFQVAPVRTEALPDGRLQLLEGVSPGTKVVIGGAFTLKSEFAKGELGEGHAH